MSKTEPVGLGMGKFRLSNNHPFFIASVYHDGAWEAIKIYQQKINWEDLKGSIIINDDPDYYYEVVKYQYEHLLTMLDNGFDLYWYIKYHDEVFFDICYKIARAKGSAWLKYQSYLFYFLVSSYRKFHFRKDSN